jgi:hypothetical protein
VADSQRLGDAGHITGFGRPLWTQAMVHGGGLNMVQRFSGKKQERKAVRPA